MKRGYMHHSLLEIVERDLLLDLFEIEHILDKYRKEIVVIEYQDRFDSLIQYWCEKYNAPFSLIKSVIRAESAFNPKALSHCGAKGLMQLMPDTDFEIDGEFDGFDIEGNIKDGIKYLMFLYSKYPEIEDPQERYRFACAAYNAGRGNINKAIAKARAAGVDWQKWEETKKYLPEVTGRLAKETTAYIDKIFNYLA